MFEENNITCKYCGAQGLEWYETENGWRLFKTHKGRLRLHDCRMPKIETASELFKNLDEGIRKLELDEKTQSNKNFDFDDKPRLLELD